eukprot:2236711-Amphidinium_carterae.2
MQHAFMQHVFHRGAGLIFSQNGIFILENIQATLVNENLTRESTVRTHCFEARILIWSTLRAADNKEHGMATHIALGKTLPFMTNRFRRSAKPADV